MHYNQKCSDVICLIFLNLLYHTLSMLNAKLLFAQLSWLWFTKLIPALQVLILPAHRQQQLVCFNYTTRERNNPISLRCGRKKNRAERTFNYYCRFHLLIPVYWPARLTKNWCNLNRPTGHKLSLKASACNHRFTTTCTSQPLMLKNLVSKTVKKLRIQVIEIIFL